MKILVENKRRMKGADSLVGMPNGPSPDCRETYGPQKAFRRWLPVVLYVTAVYLTEVLLSSIELSYGEEGASKIVQIAVNISLLTGSLTFVLFSLRRVVQMVRKKWRANVLTLVLVAVLFPFFTMSTPDIWERFHVVLYFPLGMLVYRAYLRRSASIRFCLNILFLFFTIVFLDNLVQGLLPNRSFSLDGSKNLGFVLMPILGFLFTRACDFQRPILLPWKHRRKEERRYSGKKPLIDIHFYERDLLYPVLFGILLITYHFITNWVEDDDLAGRWQIGKDPGWIVVLGEQGSVRCDTGDGLKDVGGFQVTGDLFNGFFFTIYPHPKWDERSCAFLKPYINNKRRFRIKGGFIEFNETAKRLEWVTWTFFGTEVKRGVGLQGKEGTQEIWEKLS